MDFSEDEDFVLTQDTQHFLSSFLCGKIIEGYSLCFDGPMGIGKSTLIRSVMELFGLKYRGSPTYGMAHEYQLDEIKIVHIDFYQKASIDILAYLDHIALVEWGSMYPHVISMFNPLIYVKLDWCNYLRKCRMSLSDS